MLGKWACREEASHPVRAQVPGSTQAHGTITTALCKVTLPSGLADAEAVTRSCELPSPGERTQMQLFVVRWVPRASVRRPGFSGDTKAQCGLPGARLNELGHRSGAGHQVLAQPWQLRSLRSWAPPFSTPRTSRHGSGESPLETCWHLLAHPVVVEGRGLLCGSGGGPERSAPGGVQKPECLGLGDLGCRSGAWAHGTVTRPASLQVELGHGSQLESRNSGTLDLSLP